MQTYLILDRRRMFQSDCNLSMSEAKPEGKPEEQKRCKRPGCLKYYLVTQNNEGDCHYHVGAPIFHDTKKGWTCCPKVVYDWDQFQKLPTCTVGKHTDIKEEGPEFFKSNTVKNAQNAIQKSTPVVIKDITQYNKEIEEKKKAEQAAQEGAKKPFVTKEGKFKCVNQGCLKSYIEPENHEDACGYHKGAAVFHDLKKYWNCCGKETHDWDQFMKLPTCCRGWHSPKMV